MQLFEQYRPNNWSQVVGQGKAVETIQRLAKRGLAGRAWWLSGESGTGKTTLARLIAKESADHWAIEEIDAQWLTPSRINDLARQTTMRPIGGRAWAFIVNEAHGLSDAAVRALLVALEPIPDYVVWIFTTTVDGQEKLFEGCDDSAPLLSRCTQIGLARRDLAKVFASHAKTIADAEGLAGDKTEDWFVKLAQKRRNNLRAMLCDLEAGAALA